MATCEMCGNHYDKTFDVVMNGERHTFDCFECAIHRMAPACTNCGCRIVGHGVEVDERLFCGAHCARSETGANVRDRASVLAT
ncbi:MAG: hypothetical protein ACOYNI_03505 [Acidimicrobiia bacterium]